MTVPEMLDSDTRQTYNNILFKTGYRKLRSFGKGHDTVRVFYSRKAAVDAFTALVETAAIDAITNAPTEADRVNAIIAHADLIA